jgi:hypothetical protein
MKIFRKNDDLLNENLIGISLTLINKKMYL